MVTSDTLPATGSDRSELNSPVPSEMALAPTTPLQHVAPAAPTSSCTLQCILQPWKPRITYGRSAGQTWICTNTQKQQGKAYTIQYTATEGSRTQ